MFGVRKALPNSQIPFLCGDDAGCAKSNEGMYDDDRDDRENDDDRESEEESSDTSKVKNFALSPECCIYRVPPDQRQTKPEAYIPKVVLIGPLQYARKLEAKEIRKKICTTFDSQIIKYRCELYLDMEQRKAMYNQSFFARATAGDVKASYQRYLEENEEKIRKCYAESTTWIKTKEFVGLILLDAIFILEYLIRCFENRSHRDDLVFRARGLRNGIYKDLFLLENQLPFFVLEYFYENAPFKEKSFRDLCCEHYKLKGVPEGMEFKHFTDLIRYRYVRSLKPIAGGEFGRSFYNAEKLRESGVRFTIMERDDKYSMNVEFENKQLKMPHIAIYDGTQVLWRNIMAFEQCHCPHETYVCDYMSFLDSLIDTEKDVAILVENGILENHIGDDASLADMINRITFGNVLSRKSSYSLVIERLMKHHSKPWNRAMAALRHNYFINIWTGTATVGGIIFILLTFVQAGPSIIDIIQAFGG